MKPRQISVLVSKKLGKDFCSWSVSYGTTADLEESESFDEALLALDKQLRSLITEQLPTSIRSSNNGRVSVHRVK